MKRTVIILAIIAVLGAGWTAGWHYVAGNVERVVADARERLAERDRDFNCNGQDISGFPFRINYNCADIHYEDGERGLVFKAGALRTAAQAYQPGKVVAELEGPARLRLPRTGQAEIRWELLRSSFQAGLSGVDQVAVVGTNVEFLPQDVGQDEARLNEMQFHGRKSGDNDGDFALHLIKVASPQGRWPEFNLDTSIHFKQIYKELLRRPNLVVIGRRDGLEGQVDRLDYELADGGTISITGPFSVTRGGLLSGDFQVSATQIGQLVAALRKAMPQQEQMLDQAAAIVQLAGNARGDKPTEMRLVVKDGNVRIGLIPLGTVPPLY